MKYTQNPKIIFKQNKYESEEEWDYKWSDEQFDDKESSDGKRKYDVDELTIITTDSDESDTNKSFKLKYVTNISNLKKNCLRKAKIRFENLYKFYPVPKDPGLDPAFWTLQKEPTVYKRDGIDRFFDITKLLKLNPISSLRKQLQSDTVNLNYYCADSKIVDILMEVLRTNVTVKILDLKETFLTTDTCYHLNKLLLQNVVLTSLNLEACKIGASGAKKLEEGLTNSSGLIDLNLSSCNLGSKGLYYIAKAIGSNSILQNLNISNNNLDETSVIYLQQLIQQTQSLVYLNISWNKFETKEAGQTIFKSLIENNTITNIDLSWNSIGKTSFPSINRYIINSKTVTHLNLSANRFKAEEGARIAQALLNNRHLQELYLHQNPLRSEGVTQFIEVLESHEFLFCPLVVLDFGHLWAAKTVIPILEKLRKTKPNLKIKIGGILENFKIVGPNLKELFFKAANHEAMNCKRKKDRKNFGLFVLKLEDTIISKEKFAHLLEKSFICVNENLVSQIMNQFSVNRKNVNQAALKESYKSLFPKVKLPVRESLVKDEKKASKKKKSKGKKKRSKGKKKKSRKSKKRKKIKGSKRKKKTKVTKKKT